MLCCGVLLTGVSALALIWDRLDQFQNSELPPWEQSVVSLIQNVMWPAVAGNVAWAFVTVPVTDGFAGAKHVPVRLTVLGILAVYLFSDWMLTDGLRRGGALRRFSWIGDILTAGAIATFAIMTATPPGEWAAYALGSVFVVAGLSHISGIWRPKGTTWYPWSLIMAAVHALSLMIMFLTIGPYETQPFKCGLAVSVLVAVVGYWFWAWTLTQNVDQQQGR